MGYPGSPLAVRHQGKGHHEERHSGLGHLQEDHAGHGHDVDCRHLLIRHVAGAPYRHPRCSRLTQLLTELPPLGEDCAPSKAQRLPPT
jgi:hypothetical protein